MTRRILPPAEYPRLHGTELDAIWPHLPSAAQVIVVEEGDQIVACWAGFPLWHAEGVWIAPAHRGKGAAARLLLEGMTDVSARAGFQSVVTAAMDPTIETLLEKLGAVSLPGTHWALPVTHYRKAG